MLHEFITANKGMILARTRAKAASRMSLLPNETQLKNGVPLFLSQLIDRLRHATADTGAIGVSATLHGGELQAMEFTVAQVIRGYGDVCQVITTLAAETDAPITIEEYHLLNLCLDDAIASSVTEHQRRRETSATQQGADSPGILAHEMRNRLNSALLAYSMLQQGTVAIGGRTGILLGRNLQSLRVLIDNSLFGARVEAGIAERSRTVVAEVVREIEEEATLEIAGDGSRLVVAPIELDIEVDADRQILTAALGNLIQNAFKFNRPSGLVSLRTTATATRVLIEVEDECGGLPKGQAEGLFRPFEQRGVNRSGLGLGLSISRRGVEAMGGTLRVRDLPGKGCVFFIDLPRLPSA